MDSIWWFLTSQEEQVNDILQYYSSLSVLRGKIICSNASVEGNCSNRSTVYQLGVSCSGQVIKCGQEITASVVYWQLMLQSSSYQYRRLCYSHCTRLSIWMFEEQLNGILPTNTSPERLKPANEQTPAHLHLDAFFRLWNVSTAR